MVSGKGLTALQMLEKSDWQYCIRPTLRAAEAVLCEVEEALRQSKQTTLTRQQRYRLLLAASRVEHFISQDDLNSGRGANTLDLEIFHGIAGALGMTSQELQAKVLALKW